MTPRLDEIMDRQDAIERQMHRDLANLTPEQVQLFERMIEADNRLIDALLEREALVALRQRRGRWHLIAQGIVAALALALLIGAIAYDLSMLAWVFLLWVVVQNTAT